MKTYEEYKDSGVEWIGEIPVGWVPRKVKYLYRSDINPISTDEMDGKQVVHYSIPNVQECGSGVVENGSDIESSKNILEGQEVIVSRLNPRKKTVCVTERSDLPTVSSGEFVILRPSEEIDLSYSYYVMITDRITQLFDSLVESVTRSHQRIRPERLVSTPIPLPTLPEQQQIVTYLDQKTSQIDELIDKKTRKIELLKEYRTSLINQVVTKGLDPNVEMKDSGVEWIGEIPVGWEIIQGKYILEICSSNYPTEIVEDIDGVPFVKVDDLNRTTDQYYLDSCELSVQETSSVPPLEKNMLLFPKRGMSIFKNKIVICRMKPYIDPNLMGVNVYKTRNLKYVMYFIKNRGLGDICDSSTIPQINNKHIYPLRFTSPPLPEQQQIVTYLDQKTQEIDQSIQTEEKKIEHLKEYRQSLISNVVTGKIDVRDTVLS
jgi:type I restriction enzyme, S subunit